MISSVRRDVVGSAVEVVTAVKLAEAADAFLRSVRAQGQSHNSFLVLESCLRQLVRHYGSVKVDEAAKLLTDYLAFRASRLKRNSYRAEFSHLRQFMAFCHYEGWIERSPFARLKGPAKEIVVTQPLTDEEILTMLKMGDTWGRAAIILLLGSGMRIGELAALRWEDVRGDTLLLHGKGKRQRVVAPGSAAMRALMTLPRRTDYVFPFTYAHIEYELRKLAQRSHISCHPHTLRHTFAHRYLNAGGAIQDLAEIMGHDSIQTTWGYVRGQRPSVLESQRRLNPADALFKSQPHTERVESA
jgi:site-specific recombinase XerD